MTTTTNLSSPPQAATTVTTHNGGNGAVTRRKRTGSYPSPAEQKYHQQQQLQQQHHHQQQLQLQQQLSPTGFFAFGLSSPPMMLSSPTTPLSPTMALTLPGFEDESTNNNNNNNKEVSSREQPSSSSKDSIVRKNSCDKTRSPPLGQPPAFIFHQQIWEMATYALINSASPSSSSTPIGSPYHGEGIGGGGGPSTFSLSAIATTLGHHHHQQQHKSATRATVPCSTTTTLDIPPLVPPLPPSASAAVSQPQQKQQPQSPMLLLPPPESSGSSSSSLTKSKSKTENSKSSALGSFSSNSKPNFNLVKGKGKEKEKDQSTTLDSLSLSLPSLLSIPPNKPLTPLLNLDVLHRSGADGDGDNVRWLGRWLASLFCYPDQTSSNGFLEGKKNKKKKKRRVRKGEKSGSGEEVEMKTTTTTTMTEGITSNNSKVGSDNSDSSGKNRLSEEEELKRRRKRRQAAEILVYLIYTLFILPIQQQERKQEQGVQEEGRGEEELEQERFSISDLLEEEGEGDCNCYEGNGAGESRTDELPPSLEISGPPISTIVEVSGEEYSEAESRGETAKAVPSFRLNESSLLKAASNGGGRVGEKTTASVSRWNSNRMKKTCCDVARARERITRSQLITQYLAVRNHFQFNGRKTPSCVNKNLDLLLKQAFSSTHSQKQHILRESELHLCALELSQLLKEYSFELATPFRSTKRVRGWCSRSHSFAKVLLVSNTGLTKNERWSGSSSPSSPSPSNPIPEEDPGLVSDHSDGDVGSDDYDYGYNSGAESGDVAVDNVDDLATVDSPPVDDANRMRSLALTDFDSLSMDCFDGEGLESEEEESYSCSYPVINAVSFSEENQLTRTSSHPNEDSEFDNPGFRNWCVVPTDEDSDDGENLHDEWDEQWDDGLLGNVHIHRHVEPQSSQSFDANFDDPTGQPERVPNLNYGRQICSCKCHSSDIRVSCPTFRPPAGVKDSSISSLSSPSPSSAFRPQVPSLFNPVRQTVSWKSVSCCERPRLLDPRPSRYLDITHLDIRARLTVNMLVSRTTGLYDRRHSLDLSEEFIAMYRKVFNQD